MEILLLTTEQVIELHDMVLNHGELEGLAGDKSIDGALARVAFRVHYSLVSDVFDVAAMYAVAIAEAHAFNDANKRTAYAAMKLCLKTHGVTLAFDTKEVGNVIIAVAEGKLDEEELATWLRERSQK